MDPVAIVFDLDGTIWDSWPWYAHILSEFSDSDESDLLYKFFEGASIVSLCRNYGVSNDHFISSCRKHIADLNLHSGVIETLSNLQQQGISLGVFTSLPKWVAHPILLEKNILDMFGVVITSARGQPRKPNPTGLIKALNQLGVSDRRNAIYVGDTNDDALTAKNAGIKFAWVKFGYAQDPPTYRIASLEKIEEIINVKI